MIDLQKKKALLLGAGGDVMDGVTEALRAAGAAVVDGCAAVTAGDQPGIRAQIADLGAFDIVVIQPAWRQFRSFLESTPEDWDAALALNFERPTYMAQEAARQMVENGRGGRIIFLLAVQSLMPFSGAVVLGTTLTMISTLAKMAAVDLALYGITVNVVAAGWLESADFHLLDAATREHICAGVPLARTGSASDAGRVVAFLASDLAGYITGTILPVDGGYTLTRSDGKSMLEA